MKYDMRVRKKEWEEELDFSWDNSEEFMLVMKKYNISKLKIIKTIRRNATSLSGLSLAIFNFGRFKNMNSKKMKHAIKKFCNLRNRGATTLYAIKIIKKEYDLK